MLKEFREFAMKGNVVDLAVGVISVSVRKLPQASTAPCFFASARLVALTAFDNPVK